MLCHGNTKRLLHNRGVFALWKKQYLPCSVVHTIGGELFLEKGCLVGPRGEIFFFLFHVHPAARFLVKGCRSLWWNLFSFFHVHPAARVALWTLLTCHVYPVKYKANSKECSPPPSEMELSDHFVVWSPGNILHETSWYFSSKVVCLKYDIWCCSVIDFFVGS